MHILLTNDDGIFAPGIQALWEALCSMAKITVVAPDMERSATSQAITVHHPIRVDRHCINCSEIEGWRIGGTPTDCVKIALETEIMEKPDMIISGINHGANLGTDVLYSGTVSAAMEGALHGIPALAISLDTHESFDFSTAAQFAAELVKKISEHSLPPNTLLNVNVPAISSEDIRGVAITKLGVRQYENTFQRRQDPRGRTYYWMGGNIAENTNDPDSDIMAVRSGKISVTPLHLDLTNYSALDSLRLWKL